jgi:hypothetical protein
MRGKMRMMRGKMRMMRGEDENDEKEGEEGI